MPIELGNQNHSSTPLDEERVVEELAARVASYGLSDTYQAERFAAAYGDDLRYDHQRGLWFVYRGHIWKPDRDGEVDRLAIECARQLQAEAQGIADSATRDKVLKFGKYCQSFPGIRRVLSIAQSLEPIATKGEDWNRNGWLLGTPNGVIDLQTGELREGQREDLVSLSVAVLYDPAADCPRWRQFLKEVFAGDKLLVEYLQRVMGYTLTGFTQEQVWWLLFGEGANGKSTLLNVVGSILGEYAKTVPFNARATTS